MIHRRDVLTAKVPLEGFRLLPGCLCLLASFGLANAPRVKAEVPSYQKGEAQQLSTADSPPAVPLTGNVTDTSGAIIPGASLRFAARKPSPTANEGVSTSTLVQTDSTGRFTTVLAPGQYTLTIAAQGFTSLTQLIVVGARPTPLNLHLLTAAASEQIDVPSETTASTANADNKGALVFKGEQLDTLASDDSMLQQEVTAMAGGSGEGGGQVYVNGFSGGRFPPKDTIREIRINQNPFSSQYEDLGYGRIEIFTKPGGEKLHGDFYSSGTTKAFNSLNPYTGDEPPYYLVFDRADLNGPLGKNTSFFVSGEGSDERNNAVVNALNPDTSRFTAAVPAPQTEYTLSARIDRQMSKNNTFIGRYEYSNTAVSNNGVGLLVLPSEGTTNRTNVQTLQLGNTELISSNIVSESRFGYLRTRLAQTPNSTAPTVVVQGAFNAGGSPTQENGDSQDQFEFQQYLSVARGSHFLRLGARYRLLHETNTSTANYNGQYTFADLAAYQAGTPQLFSLTTGQATAALLTGDLGAYAEDEWKLRKDLTASFGLRLESQSAVPDHLNPAPRAGVSWAIGQTEKHAPVVVVRAAAGIFYSRFAAGNILTSVRQNGVDQHAYLITNPSFYPAIPPPGELTGTSSTPYSISPQLRIATENIASVSVERSIGKIGQITATYYAVRGVHQYNSANINAPFANGTRPLGGTADSYQFQSEGIEKAQSLALNSNMHFGKRLSLFGFYSARKQNDDAFGAASFPSASYDLSADYGPTGLGFQPVAQRLFAGGNWSLPANFRINSFVGAFSRSRFNITTGTDRNNDTQFNDRPAFATNPGPTSLIYNTAYGRFDADPQPGETVIPYNFALGPRLVFAAVEFSREFKFGPRADAPAAPAGGPASAPAPKPDPRYSWRFALSAENALNTNNAGSPVGVLSSPYFGRSISANSLFGTFTAANRIVFLNTAFRF